VLVLHASYGTFRRVRRLIIGVLAAALLLWPAGSPTISQAVGTVTTTQNISNTSDMSEAPQIALGGGLLAAIWGERGGNTLGYDTTAPGTTWPGASFKSTGTKVQYQWPDIVVDGAGTYHMVYAVGDILYHRSNTVGGSLSAAHTIAGSNFPNPVRMAIAPNGTLWVVWRDGDGTGIFYRQSSDGGLNWSGGTVASEDGNMFSPDVAVDQNNIPHVVWYVRGSGTYKGEIRVADWNGSGFAKSSVTTDGGSNDCCYDADPAIAIDAQNTLHVVWRKQITANGSQWAITYARRVAGQAWSDFTPAALTNGDAKYNPSISVDSTGTIAIVYSDPTGGSRPRLVKLVSKLAGGAWEAALNLSNGPWDTRNAVVGNLGVAHVLLQHEVGTDDGEIIYDRVQIGASTPPVDATPKFAANPTNVLSGIPITFSNVTGGLDGVRYHWDAAPTDADAWLTFATSLTINGPSGVTPEACQAHVLYTQVKKGTTTSAVRQLAETFDTGVQANVQLVNPHLIGLPAAYSLNAQVANPAENGAQNGDPSYTRESYAFLRIYGRSLDCSHLATYHISGSDTSVAPAVIKDDEFNGPAVLPGSSAIGNKAIGVDVADGLANTKTYSFTLTYDPSDTDPTTSVNMAGLPVLNMGNSPSFTADNAKSIIRTLTFKNISVTDNLFGQKESLPAGKQFWGVYIANTTVPTVTVDDPSLKWAAVHVPVPNDTFSVQWDLFSGLGYTGDLTTKSGDYYVFVRFLDGAGNPSVDAIKLKVTLEAGYSIPTQRIPTVFH
jgi:hypothetical protein